MKTKNSIINLQNSKTMKTKNSTFKTLLIAAGMSTVIHTTNAQNIGINPTGVAPDNSAGLDVNFTNKGLLIPRVALTSATDGATIPSPANSLLVYNTGTGGLAPAGYYYNAGTPGSPSWRRLLVSGTPSDAWLTLGNAGTNPATHFVGTTDNVSLVFRTNNTERMRLHFSGQLSIGDNTPGGKLDVHQDAANDVARFTTYGSTNDIRLRRTQGTKTSPTATGGANTILGRIFAEGYNGSGFTAAAAIEMSTDATGGTSTDMPGRIAFWTTHDDSATLRERMRITNEGYVGIATTDPIVELDVDGRAIINNVIEIDGYNDVAAGMTPTVTGGTLFNGGPTFRAGGQSATTSYWEVTTFPASMTIDLIYPAQQIHFIVFGTSWRGDGRYIPKDYKIEYSSDGVTWVTYANVTGNTNAQVRHAAPPSSPPYMNARYVRLTVYAPQTGYTYSNVSGFQVLVNEGGAKTGTDPWAVRRKDAILAVPGNVGIGTTSPKCGLHVWSNPETNATFPISIEAGGWGVIGFNSTYYSGARRYND